MKITRSKRHERWLLDHIKDYLKKQPRAQGTHVSDIILPRKAYWRAIDPQPMTDHEAGYFIAGQGHHYIIEAIIEGSKKIGKADSGSHEWNGIYYSPDIKSPFPIEIKTSRARFSPEDTGKSPAVEYDHYLNQLRSYMAIDNSKRGALLVFYLSKQQGKTRRTKPEFRWWDVVLTNDAIGRLRSSLIFDKDLLEEAILQKDHMSLLLCPRWLCGDCVWLQKCKPWLLDENREYLKEA